MHRKSGEQDGTLRAAMSQNEAPSLPGLTFDSGKEPERAYSVSLDSAKEVVGVPYERELLLSM